MTDFKLLTIDIETSPSLAYVWGLHDQNVGLPQLVEPGKVISFAAKWRHQRKVEFRSIHHDEPGVMVVRAYALMAEADAIVHFNGVSFDMKHLRREFVLAGLPPTSPHKDIDLLSVVRKNFKFVSNKLDHVAQELGLGAKVKHTGFDLWRDCLIGDEAAKAAAWKLMKKYNIQDTLLTERLYDRLLPWIHNHPHLTLYTGVEGCQRCGSEDLERRGFAYTPLGKYQQYCCNGCGSYSRGKKNLASVDARATS